jgi:hypothetical protein
MGHKSFYFLEAEEMKFDVNVLHKILPLFVNTMLRF